MKKLFVLAAVAISMFTTSCGGTAEKETEGYLKMVDSLNVEAEKAQSAEAIQKIYDEFLTKSKAFTDKLSDNDTASEDLLKKVNASQEKLGETIAKKMEEFQQAVPAE